MQLEDTIKKWIFFFYVLDANRDGVLEPCDIDQIIDRLIRARPGLFSEVESRYLRYVTQKSFDRLLIEASNGKERKISILEWVRIIKKNNETDKESYFIRWFSVSAVRFLFDLFDHNKDGFIDFDEFESLYQILGLNRGNIIFAFKQLDVNKDGVLSKAEMHDAINDFFSSSNAAINNYAFGQYKEISHEYINKLITVLL
ncbi:MAG: EF-hand domain-containing protein [Ekhidna sp.]